jgi:hypothetical protein
MVERVSTCLCRLNSTKNGTEIDSTLCLLNPVLEAWSKIEEQAEEIVRERRRTGPSRTQGVAKSSAGRPESWAKRWAPVQEALNHLDRVLEEQKIPRSSFQCSFCKKSIEQGEILTFHGSCYNEQFEPRVDLHPIKEFAARELRPGHPARELAQILPDKIARVESTELLVAIVNLVRSREA